MTNFTERGKGLWFAYLCLAALTACGTDEQDAYVVAVTVSGGETVVAGRTVRVGNRSSPPFVIFEGVGTAFVAICTQNADKFLHASIPVALMEGAAIISMAALTPVACAADPNHGRREMDYLFVEDDGAIVSDLESGDSRVWATCGRIPSTCPRDQEF